MMPETSGKPIPILPGWHFIRPFPLPSRRRIMMWFNTPRPPGKKKPAEDIPKLKKRSVLYKWWFGNYEEMDYQAAKDAAERAENAKAAVADASVLGLTGGSAITSGTWAVRGAAGLGEIAVAGPGAPLAALLVGMYPGKLNDGEQDFIDRMRLEQMREAPSRVRYTWEQDDKGNLVPHGWHTPPGKDRVRVRKMEWDSSRKAYTFTTEEDPRITIIWTPDNTGENKPWNTGNQNPVRLPNPVVVEPLPEDTALRQQLRQPRKRRVLRIIFLFCHCRIFRRFIYI